MRITNLIRARRVFILCLFAIIAAACGRQDPAATEPAADAESAPMASAKVPVTTSSDRARALFKEGRALVDDLHFTEAMPIFEQAVQEDPEFAMGYVLLATASQTAAQFFDALEKAEANAAGTSTGEQLIIKAMAAGSRNRQMAQIAALNELVALHPKEERVHMLLGNYYNGQQDFASAITHFGHAIAINPDFATAYNAQGYAYRSNDDLESARESFAKYVEKIPDEANPYDSYAELLLEMGDYDDSIENYRKSLAIDRNFAASYAGISINESLKGDMEAALEAAAQMLSVARTPAEKQGAMFRSVTAYLFAGDIDAALETANAMYELANADGDHAAMGGVREYMGDIVMTAGDGAKAVEYFESALNHREQAETNDATKAQAKRTHMFKSAIAAIVDDDVETATAVAAKFKSAVDDGGTAFERRRVHELAGYVAMMNDDYMMSSAELALANNLNPIVLYWSAVASKNAGDVEKAKDLATRAAHRNTLSGNLPFFRAEALQLLDELSAM